MLPPELMLIRGESSIGCDLVDILYCCFCVYCGCVITPPYDCCYQDTFYTAASLRIGVSLAEWTILIILGILIDNDIITNKTSYLFELNHCLLFFIISIVFYIISTYYAYLMPDLRLPLDIPIRSMCGYAFLGEITELERLNGLLQKQYNNKKRFLVKTNFNNVWDTPARDRVFLRRCGLNKELASALSAMGYHSVMLLGMELKDDKEIDSLYQQIKLCYPDIKSSKPTLKRYLENYQSQAKNNCTDKDNCNHKLPAIFALANKQYETLKWLELKGAKQHIWLFKNRSEEDRKIYKTMGFEWARKLLSGCQNVNHKF